MFWVDTQSFVLDYRSSFLWIMDFVQDIFLFFTLTRKFANTTHCGEVSFYEQNMGHSDKGNFLYLILETNTKSLNKRENKKWKLNDNDSDKNDKIGESSKLRMCLCLCVEVVETKYE